MSEVSKINKEVEDQAAAQLELPPGFQFHPIDEELIVHYLMPNGLNLQSNSTRSVISDVDLNMSEPWDLHVPAVRGKMREQEWYFSRKDKDRKYPMRTNRASDSGNWKATRKDKEFVRGRGKKDNK